MYINILTCNDAIKIFVFNYIIKESCIIWANCSQDLLYEHIYRYWTCVLTYVSRRLF